MACALAGYRPVSEFVREERLAKRTALSPTKFINATNCRQFLLEWSRENRSHQWERVSAETLVKLNEIVRVAMVGHVRSMPSRGKTL